MLRKIEIIVLFIVAILLTKISRKKAIRILEVVVEKSPDNDFLLHTLGHQYYKDENYKNAVVALEKSNSLSESFVEYLIIGDLYVRLGNWEAASRNYELGLQKCNDEGRRILRDEIDRAEKFLRNKFGK